MMKKKILISFFWFLIAALLMSSLGQSQVIANDDSPEQEAASSPGPAYLELGAIPAIDELGQKFVDEIPELAMGDKRIVLSGQNFQPFNRSYNPKLWNYGTGCLGYYLPQGNPSDRVTVFFPIWMPIGSKITGLYWTGVDWFSSAELELNIIRNHWKGQSVQVIVSSTSGLGYASGTTFNKFVPVNHTVTTGYSYQILINLSSTHDLRYMHACQITVDYVEPTAFAMFALPPVYEEK